MHVAEATLKRAAGEDRVDAGCLVGEIRYLGRALDRVGARESHAGPIGYHDRRHVVCMRVDRGERLDQIGASRAEPSLRTRHIGLHDRVVGEPGQAPRRLAGRQRDEFGQHRARNANATAATPVA